jgi:orotidine-5'-phosphate decarboxylase
MPLVHQTRLIIALDLESFDKNVKIAKDCAQYCDSFKISWPALVYGFLEGKGNLVREVKKASGKHVIVDWKVADVPHTNEKITEMAVRMGADGLTFHGFMGQDAAQPVFDVGSSHQTDVYLVVQLSNPGAEKWMSPLVTQMCEMAKKTAANGVVVPGARPDLIKKVRELVGKECHILCPGMGAQGGKPGDAIRAGADFEIVGRSVIEAEYPPKAAYDIAMELRKAQGY